MTEPSRRAFLLGAGLCLSGMAVCAEPLRQSLWPPIAPPPLLDDLLSGQGFSGQVGCLALAGDGRVLAAQSQDQAFAPASTLKIVTALFALDRLGAGHRFATRVLRKGDTLILAGGGDPVLDSDGLAVLAARLAALRPNGVRRLLVWDGALPHLPQIAPGQPEYLAYNPAVSGIMLNFNRVELSWHCQSSCRFELQASAQRHRPKAWTVSAGLGGGPISHHQTPQGEHWSLPRRMLGQQGRRWLPVRQPALYAGDVFQTLCRAQGLGLPRPEVVRELPEGDELARVDSLPLSDILRDMLAYSTNLTAEAVGLAASGAPDLAASGRAMQDWAAGQGAQGLVCADHSGLSAQSRVTARAMVALLAGAGRRQGLAGVLKSGAVWPKAASGWAGAGLLAKTGTLNFVSNLAGYVQAGGDVAVFAIFCTDTLRHRESSGRDLPDGVLRWTGAAKAMQQKMVDSWAMALSRRQRQAVTPPLPEGAG